MFTKGTLVRYREGTEKAGEVYAVAESQYLPTSLVRLATPTELVWAKPTELEKVVFYYSVWVDGVKVTDEPLTYGDAKVVEYEWRAKDYDEVVIQMFY